MRDVTRIHELSQIEHLGLILAERSGSALVLSNLAAEVQVSVDTLRRWVETLTALHWSSCQFARCCPSSRSGRSP